MNNIKTYINEKLHISKDFKPNKLIDMNDPQCFEDILVATVIVCLRDGYYINNSVGTYRMHNLAYGPIKNLLESLFNYTVTLADIQFRKGYVWTVVSKNRYWIESLMSGKKFSKWWWKGKDNSKQNQLLSGREIKEQYKDYINGSKK